MELIYPTKSLAHQSMSVIKMYETLEKDGIVECNSPKNRQKLYLLLNKNKKKFDTEIIGYTNGEKSLCRWLHNAIGWDIGRIVKWISAKRLLADNVNRACINNECMTHVSFNFADIAPAFTNELSNKKKFNLISEKWGEKLESTKYTPFDYCVLRKTILRIKLIN